MVPTQRHPSPQGIKCPTIHSGHIPATSHRVFVHPNDQWKSLHSVIPPEVLPEEYGGKLKFDSCINLLEDIEELEDHFQEIFKFGYLKTKAGRESFRPICRKN
ncbi:hypothetical protein AVEN_182749-1 [Araneus ventricosus]|uniref:CRAL-TRIO domain-containing protein n=1 Tax=Araneus ventricosus TaxID=182803 RepID=A0A4Y2N411_ARAVE|nr:hypothetical protein AVEN_182749-1 [Araneus ventricosus]